MAKTIILIAFIFCFYASNSQIPLKPKQFFNLKGVVDIPTSENSIIYTVPNDSFLVVNDFYLDAFFSTSFILRNSETVITLKKGEWFQSHIGILFNPKDKLRIPNQSAGTSINGYYHLIGYLLPK